MTLYLIQDMATGMRLPHAKCASRAEFSHTRAPRLFHRKSDAVSALECWRMGIWYLDWRDEDGAVPQPMDGKFNDKRAKERQAMNIQIRPVRLEVGP